MTLTHSIAVLNGDGIGPEVMNEASRVLNVLAKRYGLSLKITQYDLGSRRYIASGEVLPESVFDEISGQDAILMGPFGSPDVPDGVLKQIERRFRLEFDLFIGHRPCRLISGIPSPIDGLMPDRCDIVIVRENNEGLFSEVGGTAYQGSKFELATQIPMNTRFGVERTVRYAFEVARQRRGRLTVSHKTNKLKHTGGLWERVVREVGDDYPAVETSYEKVDKTCMRLISEPETYDVIVSDTLFGDIISDVGAAIQGGKHVAPSGTINPDRSVPSLFEPLHGPAHDIAGSGKANPIGAIRTAALLLEHLGESVAAAEVDRAIAGVMAHYSGNLITKRVGDGLVEAIQTEG